MRPPNDAVVDGRAKLPQAKSEGVTPHKYRKFTHLGLPVDAAIAVPQWVVPRKLREERTRAKITEKSAFVHWRKLRVESAHAREAGSHGRREART